MLNDRRRKLPAGLRQAMRGSHDALAVLTGKHPPGGTTTITPAASPICSHPPWFPGGLFTAERF